MTTSQSKHAAGLIGIFRDKPRLRISISEVDMAGGCTVDAQVYCDRTSVFKHIRSKHDERNVCIDAIYEMLRRMTDDMSQRVAHEELCTVLSMTGKIRSKDAFEETEIFDMDYERRWVGSEDGEIRVTCRSGPAGLNNACRAELEIKNCSKVIGVVPNGNKFINNAYELIEARDYAISLGHVTGPYTNEEFDARLGALLHKQMDPVHKTDISHEERAMVKMIGAMDKLPDLDAEEKKRDTEIGHRLTNLEVYEELENCLTDIVRLSRRDPPCSRQVEELARRGLAALHGEPLQR